MINGDKHEVILADDIRAGEQDRRRRQIVGVAENLDCEFGDEMRRTLTIFFFLHF